MAIIKITLTVVFIIFGLLTLTNCKSINDLKDDLCSVACPKIIDPVCGSDGDTFKLFPNLCLLNKQNCENKQSWIETNELLCVHQNYQARLQCIKPCQFIYLPICGFDGTTYKLFENQCIYEMENCLDNQKWITTKMNKCELQEDISV